MCWLYVWVGILVTVQKESNQKSDYVESKNFYIKFSAPYKPELPAITGMHSNSGWSDYM